MIKNRDKVETVDLDQQQLKLDQIACNLIKSSTNTLPTTTSKCKLASTVAAKVDPVCVTATPSPPPPSTSTLTNDSSVKTNGTSPISKPTAIIINTQFIESLTINSPTALKTMSDHKPATPEETKQETTQLIRPLVFCGPSGSGKSTLLKKLLREYKDCFGFSISHTTRKPRNGEVNGKDYYFVEREYFLKAIENGEFIETAEFAGNFYGTSKKAVRDVQDQNKICILDIDIEGVKNLKKTDFNPIYIFIKPPTIDVLEFRLRERGSETEENIKRRLLRAAAENSYGEIDGNFDTLIVNDNFEEAYTKLRVFVESHYNVQRTIFEPTESRQAPSAT